MALSSEDRRNQGREAAPEQDGQGNNGDNIGEWSQEDLQEELKKLPGYVDRKTNRLRREQFDAMDTSPLVRHFVANITDSSGGGRKSLKMNWTLPPIDLYARRRAEVSRSAK
eukprot:CAMPEP_0196596592 /NCGR_PEP_ID=MMETSP1081-20130531/86830_1 /TAXON_ID=36882 /ORGANISM="Pyramimonas amylifera, Strain CCMP720" /LENGTH=111 /DNA_ID=CAMNT_0041921669 /DNA_START=70 /DNA_END=405 /DNA_ORIENTATION=-